MTKKVALITGGSNGIGSSTVKEFAKKGYNVVINYYNDLKSSEELKKEIEDKYGIKALVIKCDVKNEEAVKNMIEKTYSEFNRIDVVVNNAGICNDDELFNKTANDFINILSVNLVGPFLVSKYAYKYLKETKGNIINISSTNGIDTNYVESIDYDASKAGLISLTKNLALSFSPDIRVNTIAPGWVNTRMNENLEENFKTKELNKILLNRFADPSEIAKVVTFIASDDASFINGETIRVDGGIK